MRKQLKAMIPLGMAISLLAPGASSLAADAAAASANHVQHVLLISVDGLHQLDLANYVRLHPDSTLAELSRHGITYDHAAATKPSDSFPGLLALVTGGTPNSTGVFYDDSYDRNLLPPSSSKSGDKPGTEVLYDETVDKDMNAIDGGGGIQASALPRDPVTKQPVYPHQFLRVNTIFEVVKSSGKTTAWSDKHLAYDLVNGPSGKGVDDLYTPEIVANGDATSSIQATENYDDLKVAAILNEIDGKDHTGSKAAPVPALFGMNFQEVSVAQKIPGNGYTDASGNVSSGLADALNHTDQALGKMVSELKKQQLYASTSIIITAKHGQSPIDPSKLKIVDKKLITDGIPDDQIAQVTADDVALIWLTDSSKTDSAVAAINKNKDKASIKDIYTYGSSNPQWPFNNPAVDSRVPDIVVQPSDGVIYTKPGKKMAEHGGFSNDDTNVALLISNAGIAEARQNHDAVTTTQVAPTIVQMLGLSPADLQAVQKEHTQPLPSTAASVEPVKKNKGFKLLLSGKELDASQYGSVTLVGGRTMLSVQEASQLFGASVQWNDSDNVTLSLNNVSVKLATSSNAASVNNRSQMMDVGAVKADGTTLLPLRFVAEAFGKKVGWTSSDNVSIITIE